MFLTLRLLLCDPSQITDLNKFKKTLFFVFLCTLVMKGSANTTPEETQSISDEEWDQATEFATMLTRVAELLNRSADVERLKGFLELLGHPRTGMRYIDVKLFENCRTPQEIIMALVPQYMNFVHTDLLRRIVNMFGDEQSKTLLKHYEDNFPHKKPLKRRHEPISDETIEAGTGTKRIKVTTGDTTTRKDVERTQGIISRNTGIDESMIV